MSYRYFTSEFPNTYTNGLIIAHPSLQVSNGNASVGFEGSLLSSPNNGRRYTQANGPHEIKNVTVISIIRLVTIFSLSEKDFSFFRSVSVGLFFDEDEL